MKFMESFLATRSKLPSSEPSVELPGMALDLGLSTEDTPDALAGGHVGGFQSLRSALLGSRNVSGKAQAVALPVQGGGSEEAVPKSEPTVEVIRNGDRVEKLIVTCSCCRQIELDCVY